jgi:hypothetical protein
MVVSVDTRSTLYARFPKNGVGAEIGVCRGLNAAMLYMSARPKKLHLVDIWDRDILTEIHHPKELHYNDWESDVRSLFNEEIKLGFVEIHRQTGVLFLTSCEDKSLDWVYLDSDHSYENISKELYLAISKVKTGGIIGGHDFMVHEGAWGSGVVRAVIDEIQKGRIHMQFITDERFPSYLCYVL